jgi:hypothetical protein
MKSIIPQFEFGFTADAFNLIADRAPAVAPVSPAQLDEERQALLLSEFWITPEADYRTWGQEAAKAGCTHQGRAAFFWAKYTTAAGQEIPAVKALADKAFFAGYSGE